MNFFSWKPAPNINAEIRWPDANQETRDCTFAYRLASSPNEWQPCISPGCDLTEVEARLKRIHRDDFLEVVRSE